MTFVHAKRFFALAAIVGLALLPASLSSVTVASADGESSSDTMPTPGKPVDLAPEPLEATPAIPEATRIQGKIYKIDPDARTVGILVQQKRAYRKFKLEFDENSLVLIGGQPSNFAALLEGQMVEAGYFKKGKQEIVDTIVVVPEA